MEVTEWLSVSLLFKVLGSREETHSKPSQSSKMNHFAKIVNGCQRLSAVNYFRKKIRLRCSTGFWIHPCRTFLMLDLPVALGISFLHDSSTSALILSTRCLKSFMKNTWSSLVAIFCNSLYLTFLPIPIDITVTFSFWNKTFVKDGSEEFTLSSSFQNLTWNLTKTLSIWVDHIERLDIFYILMSLFFSNLLLNWNYCKYFLWVKQKQVV